MSFSASTCLSYTGTTTLTEPISIYTFSDVFITAVTLNQITNCPLVLTGIPDGTSTIKLKSANFYCCDVPLTCNDLCTTCDLSFDSYSTSLISRIVAGNLTGSCQPSIAQYRINWFKSPDFTTPIFTSGYGTEFIPYNYTHPLTGATSPMTIAGTYTPIIDKIKLNGLNYSQTGGTGFIQANLECFNSTTVVVQAYRCDNGTESGDYTHRVQFSGASAGVQPLIMSSTFEISAATTNYFAWKFAGFAVPDTLTLTYYGSHYSYNPIILEKWVVGINTETNIDLLTLPKSGKTPTYFSKVTSLTSLTRNTGDYIKLEVTPNPNNNQTNWDFYFTCKNTFNCNICAYDYLNTPYKIKASSITGTTGSCSSISISFDVSGCTTNSINTNDITRYQATGLYSVNNTQYYNISTDNTTQLLTNTTSALKWVSNSCGGGYQKYIEPPTCLSPANTNTISFQKSNTGPFGQGFVQMSFNNLSDFSAYYSSFLSILPYSGTPSTPSLTTYYRWYELSIPERSGSQVCGDGTNILRYQFHYSSVLTTGFTSGNYTITITMPTITNGMPPYNLCDTSCQSYHDGAINDINNSSTGTTNVTAFTSNTGSRYLDPFGRVFIYYQNAPIVASAATAYGYFMYSDWLNTTMPFSGNTLPYTPIPTLSASTCNNYTSAGTNVSWGARQMFMYYYDIKLTDPLNVESYQILARPIINGVYSLTYDTVATVINGVLQLPTNPLYTY